jgi:hypothetical protein
MSNLYNSLRPDDVANPSQGWVYASAQYKIFTVVPSEAPDSRDKFDRVGHTMMISINPDWVCQRSLDGEILMVVGSTRWDAASIKQKMERECFQATAGDVTYTVAESTGYWGGGNYTITLGGSAVRLIVNENFTYWRNTNLLQEDSGTYYLETTRTNANTPADTNIPGDDDYWKSSDEAILIEAAARATNWNLGNYQSGNYNEFPLDLAITNGSNLRLYHFDLDEVDSGDWDRVTGEAETGGTYEGSGLNLYDYGYYFDSVIRQLNPLCYVLSRAHDDATESGVSNRLAAFIENDKFGADSEFAHAQFIGGIGGDLEQDGNTPETDAGQVVVPIMFRQVDPNL